MSSTVAGLGALELPTAGGCGVYPQMLAPSLDAQTLYHFDSCNTANVGVLTAVDLSDLLARVESAGPVPTMTTIDLDDDLGLTTAFGIDKALLVRDEIAPVPGGPVIGSATVEGSMLLQNDAQRVLDIVPAGGESFADVQHVFLGDRKIDAVVTADLIQATVPQWAPAGDRLVGVIDASGDVSVYLPDRLPDGLRSRQRPSTPVRQHHLGAWSKTVP